MFSKQKFAQRIFELRKQHKEKQGDLGEAIGIGRNAVSDTDIVCLGVDDFAQHLLCLAMQFPDFSDTLGKQFF